MIKKKKSFRKKEEIKVSGKNLVSTLKKLIEEGNVRHVLVKNKSGKTIFEFPLTAGVIGAALLPVFAGLGAVAAMIGDCTITIERTKE